VISLPFLIFFDFFSTFFKPIFLVASICLYMIIQNMANNEITFNNLPEAIGYLIKEVSEIKEFMFQQSKPIQNKGLPIGIDDASQIIGKAKSTIYTLVQKRLIPCYKIGKKLYFYEEELLDWISTGRKKSIVETRDELEKEMYQNTRYQLKNKF